MNTQRHSFGGSAQVTTDHREEKLSLYLGIYRSIFNCLKNVSIFEVIVWKVLLSNTSSHRAEIMIGCKHIFLVERE